MPDQYAMQDPTTRFPAPVRERQAEIAHPGLTADMISPPDHGENTYRGSGRLEGRRAIVTGADSGIGRAVAIAFAREGADVVLSYLDEEEQDARETARWVEEAGRKAVSVPGDLRSEEHCSALVETAVRELGGLDILVNNAAFQMVQMGGIADITTEQFDRVMKTNLYALFWLSKAAIAQMEPGSTIVNTSSIQGASPSPELLDYATTKAGIIDFTKGLAADVARKGIRVNAVAPGPIWTPLIPATMPKEKFETFGDDVPLNRRFQEQIGTTPLQWLHHARLRQAQFLLETTDHSIERVAGQVGFNAVTTFRERFRDLVGTSPQRYRTQFRTSR